MKKIIMNKKKITPSQMSQEEFIRTWNEQQPCKSSIMNLTLPENINDNKNLILRVIEKYDKNS